MRFLVDAQLPPALARWFGEHGFSATPVRELGLRDSDDGSIMNHAVSGEWTVVTKEEDFVARSLQHPSPPRIVWLRIGNCTNKVLLRWPVLCFLKFYGNWNQGRSCSRCGRAPASNFSNASTQFSPPYAGLRHDCRHPTRGVLFHPRKLGVPPSPSSQPVFPRLRQPANRLTFGGRCSVSTHCSRSAGVRPAN